MSAQVDRFTYVVGYVGGTAVAPALTAGPKVRVCPVCPGDLVQVRLGTKSGLGSLIPDTAGLLPHLRVIPVLSGADTKLGYVGGTQGEVARGSEACEYMVDIGQVHAPFQGEVWIEGGAVDPNGVLPAFGLPALGYDFSFSKKPGRRRVPNEHSLSFYGAGGTGVAPVAITVPMGATHVYVAEPTAVQMIVKDGTVAGFSQRCTLNPGERYPIGPVQSILIDNPPASLFFSILL